MDCKTAKEKINIFDALSEQDKERVLAHAQGCESCTRELVNIAKLRDALGSMDELESPLGLASSAIARAKKKRRIPTMAYISVAAAAAVAVAVIVSSGMLSTGADNAADQVVEMAVEEQMVRSDEDFGVAEAPMAEMVEAAAVADSTADDTVENEGAADEAPEQAAVMEEPEEESEEESDGAMAKSGKRFIYVSADMTAFAEQLDAFFTEFDVYVEYKEFDGNTSTSFYLSELYFDSFVDLLAQADIEYDDSLIAGDIVEVTFVN